MRYEQRVTNSKGTQYLSDTQKKDWTLPRCGTPKVTSQGEMPHSATYLQAKLQPLRESPIPAFHTLRELDLATSKFFEDSFCCAIAKHTHDFPEKHTHPFICTLCSLHVRCILMQSYVAGIIYIHLLIASEAYPVTKEQDLNESRKKLSHILL